MNSILAGASTAGLAFAAGVATLLIAGPLVLVRTPRALVQAVGGHPTQKDDFLFLIILMISGLAGMSRWGGSFANRLEAGAVAEILVAAAVLDARYLIVPDLYVLALGAIALINAWRGDFGAALAGAAVGGGLLFALYWAWRRWANVEAIGWGDIKFIVPLGALMGPTRLLWVIFLGSVLGLGWGWAVSTYERTQLAGLKVPLATSLSMAALICLAWSWT